MALRRSRGFRLCPLYRSAFLAFQSFFALPTVTHHVYALPIGVVEPEGLEPPSPDCQSGALPLSYGPSVVLAEGVEPPTFGLRARCSAS